MDKYISFQNKQEFHEEIYNHKNEKLRPMTTLINKDFLEFAIYMGLQVKTDANGLYLI